MGEEDAAEGRNYCKATELREASKAKGSRALEHLADELAAQARKLAAGGARAIAVMVNRVATARFVYARLRADEKHDTVLMTGRMRPIDRDAIVTQWQPRLAASDDRQPLDRPVFVVATQCLEVGANLDFDALVTECASLDALRQRFGRLNRLGKLTKSPGVIVVQAAQAKDSEDDPVYGSALALTWQWLRGDAERTSVDMGVVILNELVSHNQQQEPDILTRLNAPMVNAPVMLPAHADCWVQTSEAPCPDPDPAVFLHGPRRSPAEVQVCWRADLTPQDEREAEKWIQAVSLCPPSSSECMPVSMKLACAWLAGGDSTGADMTDVEGAAAGDEVDEQRESKPATRAVVRWRGKRNSGVLSDPDDLRPGDTLVIPAMMGGWDVFGHVPASPGGRIAIDLGEVAFQRSRDQAILRLHQEVMREWPQTIPLSGCGRSLTWPRCQTRSKPESFVVYWSSCQRTRARPTGSRLLPTIWLAINES